MAESDSQHRPCVCPIPGNILYTGNFRPCFNFALYYEGEFKTGLFELCIKDYVRKLEVGELKTRQISLRSSQGENNSGQIQSRIQYFGKCVRLHLTLTAIFLCPWIKYSANKAVLNDTKVSDLVSIRKQILFKVLVF